MDIQITHFKVGDSLFLTNASQKSKYVGKLQFVYLVWIGVKLRFHSIATMGELCLMWEEEDPEYVFSVS